MYIYIYTATVYDRTNHIIELSGLLPFLFIYEYRMEAASQGVRIYRYLPIVGNPSVYTY